MTVFTLQLQPFIRYYLSMLWARLPKPKTSIKVLKMNPHKRNLYYLDPPPPVKSHLAAIRLLKAVPPASHSQCKNNFRNQIKHGHAFLKTKLLRNMEHLELCFTTMEWLFWIKNNIFLITATSSSNFLPTIQFPNLKYIHSKYIPDFHSQKFFMNFFDCKPSELIKQENTRKPSWYSDIHQNTYTFTQL